MDQIRRKPHAHEAQHSSRLIRLIIILRCLCGCQDLMFRLTYTQRSAYQVTIFSVEWVSNDSRETNLNIQNPFDIVFRCIWHHDSSQREEKREVKSHHEFIICCVFVTLFYFPLFFLLSLKSSFMVSSRLENWSMRQKVTWREREHLRVRIENGVSIRGSLLKRFDGTTQRRRCHDWFPLWQFLFVWISLYSVAPWKRTENVVVVDRRKSQSPAGGSYTSTSLERWKRWWSCARLIHNSTSWQTSALESSSSCASLPPYLGVVVC